MPVLTLEDVMVTKLLALREHEVDYDSVLEVARSLREQIDWNAVRNDRELEATLRLEKSGQRTAHMRRMPFRQRRVAMRLLRDAKTRRDAHPARRHRRGLDGAPGSR